MAAVNAQLMFDANETDFVVLESLKEKRGIVTGNLTTPYIFNFISLKPGPLQIDYPAGATAGGVLDFWQRPVCDLGLTGPDEGHGASYIIVGPEAALQGAHRGPRKRRPPGGPERHQYEGTAFQADGRMPGVIIIRSGDAQPRTANASLPPIEAANGLIYRSCHNFPARSLIAHFRPAQRRTNT